VVDCDFGSNRARERGGAITQASRQANIVTSIFTSNEAVEGGGIFVHKGQSNLAISISTFFQNKAMKQGGAIFHQGGDSTGKRSLIKVINTVFKRNEPEEAPIVANEHVDMDVWDPVLRDLPYRDKAKIVTQ
jgi:predicted outer membrane repeat protein